MEGTVPAEQEHSALYHDDRNHVKWGMPMPACSAQQRTAAHISAQQRKVNYMTAVAHSSSHCLRTTRSHAYQEEWDTLCGYFVVPSVITETSDGIGSCRSFQSAHLFASHFACRPPHLTWITSRISSAPPSTTPMSVGASHLLGERADLLGEDSVQQQCARFCQIAMCQRAL